MAALIETVLRRLEARLVTPRALIDALLHLRIKAFYGTSRNAVETQVWIAVSVYGLVAILKKRLAMNASLYTVLQILDVSLFKKTDLTPLLRRADADSVALEAANQLSFNDL